MKFNTWDEMFAMSLKSWTIGHSVFNILQHSFSKSSKSKTRRMNFESASILRRRELMSYLASWSVLWLSHIIIHCVYSHVQYCCSLMFTALETKLLRPLRYRHLQPKLPQDVRGSGPWPKPGKKGEGLGTKGKHESSGRNQLRPLQPHWSKSCPLHQSWRRRL